MSQQETLTQAGAETSSPAGSSSAAKQPPDRPQPKRKAVSGWWVLVGGIMIAIILAGALVAATLPRLQHSKELNTAAAETAKAPPRVSVVTARPAPATSTHVLPGNA